MTRPSTTAWASERVRRDVVRDAPGRDAAAGPDGGVPALAVGAQRVDHVDPASLEGSVERADRGGGRSGRRRCRRRTAPGAPVPAGRVEQRGHHLGDLVAGAGQVDPGVEGPGGAEGQHRHRLGGHEAEDDGHQREDVLGSAGGEGGRRLRSWTEPPRRVGQFERFPGRPVEEPAATRGLWTVSGPGLSAARDSLRCCASGCVGAPPRPGRVLRRRRAARQALAARQAGRRRRRRRPRRGLDGVLRGPGVRRPLGHVDPRGPVAVSARGLPQRPLPRLPRRPASG